MGSHPKHKDKDIKKTEAEIPKEEIVKPSMESTEEIQEKIARIDTAPPSTTAVDKKTHTIGEYAKGVTSTKSGNELKLFIGLFPEEVKEILAKHSDIDASGKSNDLKVWLANEIGFTPVVQERTAVIKEMREIGINPRDMVQQLQSNPEIAKQIKALLAQQSE